MTLRALACSSQGSHCDLPWALLSYAAALRAHGHMLAPPAPIQCAIPHFLTAPCQGYPDHTSLVEHQMYTSNGKDCVIPLNDIPQSSVGAPLPIVTADEHQAAVAFYRQETPHDWAGSSVRVVDYTSDEPWAIVVFGGCYALMFGPPNDEAFNGHPLASRGLGPYGAYLIAESSWLRQLERMNAVHHRHNTETFMRHRLHFVLSFHDSTFECIASGYRVMRGEGALAETLAVTRAVLSGANAGDHLVVPAVSTLPDSDSEQPRKRSWWRWK